jgi:hypothetical protein
MEMSGQLHASAALHQGKSPWYSFDRRLGGPQSRSGRGGEEKNSQPPPGISHVKIQCNFFEILCGKYAHSMQLPFIYLFLSNCK